MALMLMDQMCYHDQMVSVYALVQKLAIAHEVPATLRLQAAAVYNTGCGDLEAAVAAARQTIQEQGRNSEVSDFVRTFSNASVSLRAAGYFDEAEEVLLKALAATESHKIDLAYSEVLTSLIYLALERGRNADARRWWELLRIRPVRPDDKFGSVDITGLSVRLALLNSDPSSARRFLPRSWKALAREPVPFHRAYHASLFVAAELGCGRIPDDGLLTLLEGAHLVTRGAIYQAYPAYALYAGLKTAGREKRGAKLLSEYLKTFRREPFPPATHFSKTFEKFVLLARKPRRE